MNWRRHLPKRQLGHSLSAYPKYFVKQTWALLLITDFFINKHGSEIARCSCVTTSEHLTEHPWLPSRGCVRSPPLWALLWEHHHCSADRSCAPHEFGCLYTPARLMKLRASNVLPHPAVSVPICRRSCLTLHLRSQGILTNSGWIFRTSWSEGHHLDF